MTRRQRGLVGALAVVVLVLLGLALNLDDSTLMPWWLRVTAGLTMQALAVVLAVLIDRDWEARCRS